MILVLTIFMKQSHYTGAPVEHPKPKGPVATIRFVQGLLPIAPEMDSDELMATYLANILAISKVYHDNFKHLSEWKLFNASSAKVRLRVFELIANLQSSVTAMISNQTDSLQQEVQSVLMYIAEHEAEPAIAHLIEKLVMLEQDNTCLLYTSPSPRDATLSRMPSSA